MVEGQFLRAELVRRYWQYPSRVKILMRENFTARWLSFSLTSFRSRITEGSLIEIEIPWIWRS